ncbi:hypothetical protein [Pseudobacter ginsenosidimutans]|uniref:Uncharacterized protein n=1 Tax=Pseudobacter ginsenosidimutans TaxID=661488 RepID=A0A4Q7N5I5_9BACT|nr:hypothetical protein [Pseudobacter ginsenosidimutans]QEC44822.1 hypothetical protein FSB84_25235 [Pseudobacter ginsenosidimutans]RZS76312.1 hypothetical protein EV199_2193 [Pseudobacter ginsenosidimutans]
MSKTIIEKKELAVPVDIILEVSNLLLEHDITNDIVGTDLNNDELLIDVQYERDERDVINQIECKISDYYVQEALDAEDDNNDDDE